MAAPSNPSGNGAGDPASPGGQAYPPTPDNYRTLYHEISGTREEAFPEKAARSLTAALPRVSPEQLRLGRTLDNAVRDQDWESTSRKLWPPSSPRYRKPEAALGRFAQRSPASMGVASFRTDPGQKRESLDHVLPALRPAPTLSTPV